MKRNAEGAHGNGQRDGHLGAAAGDDGERDADVGREVEVRGDRAARGDLTDEDGLHGNAAQHARRDVAQDDAADETGHEGASDAVPAAGGAAEPGHLVSAQVREEADEGRLPKFHASSLLTC